MKRIDLIVGVRPNFMKIAPIIDTLKACRHAGEFLDGAEGSVRKGVVAFEKQQSRA